MTNCTIFVYSYVPAVISKGVAGQIWIETNKEFIMPKGGIEPL
jgi:hypothetical protein